SEKLTENGWVTRYAFHPEAVDFPEDLNRIYDMIHTLPESTFNTELLIAGTLQDGTVSINERRCSRKWLIDLGFVAGMKRAELHEKQEMLQLVEKYSSPATLEATKKYIKKRTLA